MTTAPAWGTATTATGAAGAPARDGTIPLGVPRGFFHSHIITKQLDTLVVLRSRVQGGELTQTCMEELAEALRHAQCRLKFLSLAGHDLTPDKARILGNALMGNSTVKSLAVGHETWGDDALMALLTSSAGACAVEMLDVEWRLLGPNVAPRFHEWANLQTIKLGRNKLGDDGLIKLLQTPPPKLKILELFDNGITAMGIKQADWSLVQLQKLDLSNNIIGSRGFNSLANVIADVLILNNCEGCDAGIASLVLGQSRSKLSLAGNQLTSVGVRLISDVLLSPPAHPLISLCLARNPQIGDAGVDALASALERHPNVTIHYVDLTLIGATRLPATLVGGSIHSLVFVGNAMTTTQANEDLVKLMSNARHHGVTNLSLSGTAITHITPLLDALVAHPTLRVLEMGGLKFSEEDVMAVERLAMANPNLDVAYDRPTPAPPPAGEEENGMVER